MSQYVRFLILNKVVPMLIGVDGSQIKKMAAESGAGIAIETVQNLPFKVSDAIPQRVLTVFFENTDQLAAALTQIITVTHDARQEALKQMAKSTPQNQDVHFQCLGHKSCVSTLLAEHGKALKQIQEETKAMISIKPVLRQSSEAPINVRSQTVEGVVDAIILMTPNLLDRSAPDDGDESKKYRRYSSVLPNNDDVTSQRKVAVKTADVSYIIGKQGQRVNFIHRITACTIKIDVSEGETSQVTVHGPSRNIPHALTLIHVSKRNADIVASKKQAQ